jgi:hypothetical protein
MFSISYNNITKNILFIRDDNCSSSSNTLTPQQQLEIHCEINNLNVSDYTAVELPFDKTLNFVCGKYIYNESTGKVEQDPNWVAPLPLETTELNN